MANYNKYINTFSGATDATEWSAYITSEYAGFPNVAYLETSDMVKYRKTGTAKEAVGSIYYSDGSMTLPSEDVDTTKTPIGVVVIPFSKNYLDYGVIGTTIVSLLYVNPDGTTSTSRNDMPMPTTTTYYTDGTETGDWYYPTKEQAERMFSSGIKDDIQASYTKIITALGEGKALSTIFGYYWSTTKSGSLGYRFNITNGVTDTVNLMLNYPALAYCDIS